MSAPRILCVLQAGDAYPAGVVRALNYRDHFRRAGAEVEFINVFPPRLVRLTDSPPRLLRPIAPPVTLRAFALLKRGAGAINTERLLRIAKDYDTIYLSTIWSSKMLRRLRQATKARLVYDFGDALWASNSPVDDFAEILRTVDAVTTDNEHTAAFARKHQPNTTVIPDSPQVEVFDRHREAAHAARAGKTTVTLGWIGSASTTFGLYVIWEALERLFRKHDHLHLRLVGASEDRRLLPPFDAVRHSILPSYSQDDMAREVLGMDIGLFPLHDVEISQARGVLKACVYMAGEAAVIASPVGRTIELIRDGVNGLLPRTPDEWLAQLDRLVTDAELRARLTRAGLETVRASFTTERSFALLYPLLVPDGG